MKLVFTKFRMLSCLGVCLFSLYIYLSMTFANFYFIDVQLCCSATKDLAFCEDDDLYEDFNMDEMDLNFENYEELFGVTLNHSEELLENGGIESLFGTKDMSAADSNCQGAVAAEVSYLILSCFIMCTQS